MRVAVDGTGFSMRCPASVSDAKVGLQLIPKIHGVSLWTQQVSLIHSVCGWNFGMFSTIKKKIVLF